MMRQRFVIRDAKVVSTGFDGGHRYLTGRCEWSGDLVDVAVLMRDKSEEAKLIDGEVAVTASLSDFTRGAGLLLHDGTVEAAH